VSETLCGQAALDQRVIRQNAIGLAKKIVRS
jgi:hypothetical protein